MLCTLMDDLLGAGSHRSHVRVREGTDFVSSLLLLPIIIVIIIIIVMLFSTVPFLQVLMVDSSLQKRAG